MDLWLALLAAAAGYLFGSLSFARLVARFILPGEDIGLTEFRVPGVEDKVVMASVSATSISTRAGPKFGCLTTVLDMLKVAMPALFFYHRYPDLPYFLIAAALGVAGHNWPLYYRFKGGRGFSAIFGGLVVIDPIAIVVTTGAGLLFGLFVARDVLVAYVSGLWFLLPWLWFRTGDWTYLAYGGAVNIFFFLAMLPEIRQYVPLKRAGRVDLAVALRSNDMRHMAKLAERVGLIKEQRP